MAAAPWGGSEELWSRTALAALEQKHSVLASVYQWKQLPAPLQELQAKGAELHLRPLYSPRLEVRLRRRVQVALGTLTPLKKALDAFHPDIICVNQGGNFDLAHMEWLRNYLLRQEIPFCIVCHNYDPNQLPNTDERQAAREVFTKAQRVFFVSNEQAHVTQRQLVHILSNAELVKNPVNLSRTNLLSWPTEVVPQFAIVAGLYIDRKGHDVALEALSQAKWLDRRWHLHLYGTGPDQSYIEELVTFLKLTERVTLHGNVNDIESIWRQNHLLLVPSRREAAPLVIMEAMLCGRPIVTTAVGSAAEWINAAHAGFVAAAATVPLFDAALEQAWEAQNSWRTIGKQAYAWALDTVDSAAGTTFLNRLMQLAKASE